MILALFLACKTSSEPLVASLGTLLAPPHMVCPDSPNCVSSIAPITDAVHSIAPIASGTSYEHRLTDPAMQAQIKSLLLAMPRTRLVKEVPGYLHVTFTSQVFRFVDDVEVWFPLTEDSSPDIHIRSASRTGYGDMGVNRTRVESIRQAWTEATRSP